MNVQNIIWKYGKNKIISNITEMMCHYIDNMVRKLFYNDSKMIIKHLVRI